MLELTRDDGNIDELTIAIITSAIIQKTGKPVRITNIKRKEQQPYWRQATQIAQTSSAQLDRWRQFN